MGEEIFSVSLQTLNSRSGLNDPYCVQLLCYWMINTDKYSPYSIFCNYTKKLHNYITVYSTRIVIFLGARAKFMPTLIFKVTFWNLKEAEEEYCAQTWAQYSTCAHYLYVTAWHNALYLHKNNTIFSSLWIKRKWMCNIPHKHLYLPCTTVKILGQLLCKISHQLCWLKQHNNCLTA